MQQTKKFKMADAISPYLAVSCELIITFIQIVGYNSAMWLLHRRISWNSVKVRAWWVKYIPQKTKIISVYPFHNRSVSKRSPVHSTRRRCSLLNTCYPQTAVCVYCMHVSCQYKCFLQTTELITGGWREIDMRGWYSPVNTKCMLLYTHKNNWRRWRQMPVTCARLTSQYWVKICGAWQRVAKWAIDVSFHRVCVFRARVGNRPMYG